MEYRSASAWPRSHQASDGTDNLETQLEVEVISSEDQQWVCHYEYPSEAEAVQSSDNGFRVEVAPHLTYSVSPDGICVRCVESHGAVLLRITGDCACVISERGHGLPFGRSLAAKNGFFLVSLREGEAIRVTTHDRTQSMIYLFMDDIVNELEVNKWHTNFEPYLTPADI